MIRRFLAILLFALLTASAYASAIEPSELGMDAVPENFVLEDDPGLPELEPELDACLDALTLDDFDTDLVSTDPEASQDEPRAPVLNDSKPMPDYEGVSRELTLNKDRSFTLFAYDVLYITVPSGPLKTVSVDNEDSVTLFYDEGDYKITVSSDVVGKFKMKVKTTNGKRFTLTLIFKDPYVPKALSVKEKNISLLSGLDIDLAGIITMKPVYARTTFTYRSSDKAVAKVSEEGVVTGVGSGKATIYITSANGLKTRVTVRVSPNRTGPLHARLTRTDLLATGCRWTLWPKSLELRGNDRLICQLSLVNGNGAKITSIEGLDLGIYYDNGEGEALVARKAFDRVRSSCGRNKAQTVTLRFPAEALYCTGLKLSGIPASQLRFRLFGNPVAVSDSGSIAYRSTDISLCDASADKNPVTYRALLVSENDFYFSDEPDDFWGWERTTRNRGDVIRMNSMLKRVRTPDGSRYAVKVQHNTSHDQLVRLITQTFADADENDVSLFFIATHGDSSDDASDDMAGALVMASASEVYPEDFPLYELRDLLLKVPGKVIVILQSCGSGAAIYANGGLSSKLSRAAEAFDSKAIRLFQAADPGIATPVANTGELRVENKFYVLCASAYRELSWGDEPESGSGNGSNMFTDWLLAGVGKPGNMPADVKYAGNKNGMVDLHELYRYISGEGDHCPAYGAGGMYYQHVQVYPSDLRFALFR